MLSHNNKMPKIGIIFKRQLFSILNASFYSWIRTEQTYCIPFLLLLLLSSPVFFVVLDVFGFFDVIVLTISPFWVVVAAVVGVVDLVVLTLLLLFNLIEAVGVVLRLRLVVLVPILSLLLLFIASSSMGLEVGCTLILTGFLGHFLGRC
jgi:hypothetical protein